MGKLSYALKRARKMDYRAMFKTADMLHKMPAFFVPEVAPDVGVDRLAGLVPTRKRRRQ